MTPKRDAVTRAIWVRMLAWIQHRFITDWALTPIIHPIRTIDTVPDGVLTPRLLSEAATAKLRSISLEYRRGPMFGWHVVFFLRRLPTTMLDVYVVDPDGNFHEIVELTREAA